MGIIYLCGMNALRYLLFLNLWLLAFIGNAQDFKIIEETKDYILKVADSVYYYTHGLPPKDDFVIDTTLNKDFLGMPYFKLDNGKNFGIAIIYYNCLKQDTIGLKIFYYLNKKFGYYLYADNKNYKDSFLLINRHNGNYEYVKGVPHFSPEGKYYGYNFLNKQTSEMNLCIKKFNKKKSILLNIGNKVTRLFNTGIYIKWIDDYSFLFKSKFEATVYFKDKKIQDKYYLIQIKQ